MYKLVLADDEPDVREGLLHQINWQDLGFQVIETAENGREAMELIDRIVPDIVVTDIQMPFMNGLELSEWIKIHYPSTRIIILTGYEEFQYAQQAIKLQIDEYVLKPFSAQELVDIVLKVKQQIDEEIAERENVQQLTDHYRLNLPLLQNMFLSSLVTRRLSMADISEKSVLYELDLTGSGYIISMISVDKVIHSHMSNHVEAVPRNNSDQQLQLYAVLNIVQELVEKHELGMAFLHHDEIVILMIQPRLQTEPIIHQVFTMLEEISKSIFRFLKITITIGIGSMKKDLTGVAQSFREAQQALDYRPILGNNQLIWIEDVESSKFKTISFDDYKQKELIRCLKVGTELELHHLMQELFLELTDTKVSYQDYQIYLLEIWTVIVKVAKEMQIDLEKLFGKGWTGVDQIYKFTHVVEANTWFSDISSRLRQGVASKRQSSYTLLIKQAIEYIGENYSHTDLSINKVCDHLHISTGYFSQIIKKELNVTFVNYLMNVRMEVALEQLRSTDWKTFEIAEKVGFADANYFSFCFRKKFGISPKEYRGGAQVQ